MNLNMTVNDQIRDFLQAIGDMQYDENNVISYLNRSLIELERENKVIERETELVTMASVARKNKYELPRCVTSHVLHVRYDGEPLTRMSWHEYSEKRESDRHSTTDEPTHYAVHEGYLYLWPIPTNDAATYSLEEDIDDDNTTFELDTLSGLPEQGTLYISGDEYYGDTHYAEKVRYSGLDSDNTKVMNVERGQEDTVPDEHYGVSSTAAITYYNIEIEAAGNLRRVIPKPTKMAKLEDSGVGDGVTEGMHQVWVSYYSTTWRSESPLRWIGEIDTNGNDIGVSNIPISADPDIDKVRLYMSKANEVAAYRVKYTLYGSWYNPDESTTYTEIGGADSTLTESKRHYEPELNIPRWYRNMVTHLALAIYFEDHEQYTNAQMRRSLAAQVMDGWIFNNDNEESGYFCMGDL